MPVDSGTLLIAMAIAAILVAVIIAIAGYIHYFGREKAIARAKSQPWSVKDVIIPPRDFILLRVLLDENGHASLSVFQFMLWTLLVAVLYITLWVLHFMAGNANAPPALPNELIEVMGISIAVPIASKVIMDYKESRPRAEGEVFRAPCYASMLEENNRPSLLRLQMFLWTLAGIVIYFWAFVTTALTGTVTAETLALKPPDPSFLFLMGLSQVGYLGNKAYEGTLEKTPVVPAAPPAPAPGAAPTPSGPAPTPPSIVVRDTVPRAARPRETFILLGSGFGPGRDTLILGNEKIAPERISRWEESRIEFSIPEGIPPGNYPLRIIASGISAEITVVVEGVAWAGRIREIPADIISEIWIDDPTQKGYRLPPIGYFIPDNMYHFFFEFNVPAGTAKWGKNQFRAEFWVDGKKADENSFLPGYIDGCNYGVFHYTFTEPKESYHIEIRGTNVRTMDIVVKKPPGA